MGVRRRAAGALGSLARNTDNQVTIVQAGAIPSLVHLLSDDVHRVRKQAAGALQILAGYDVNEVRIKSEVSSHKDKELIILNLSSLAAEDDWFQDLLDLVKS